MINLSERDLKKLESLKKVNKAIYKIYKILYELEVSGQVNTLKYKKALEYLKKLTETEKGFYEADFDTYERCDLWIGYLLNKSLVNKWDTNFEWLANQDLTCRAERRIIEALSRRAYFSTDAGEALSSRGINKFGKENFSRFLNDLDILSEGVRATVFLDVDIMHAYLMFLQKAIDEEDRENVRNHLIKAKYSCIFLNEDIEFDFLSKGCLDTQEVELKTEARANFAVLGEDYYLEFKDSYLNYLAVRQINKMLGILDGEYNDSFKSSNALVRQCFLRAIFLPMSEEVLTDLNIMFHDLVDSTSAPWNKSSELIKQSFRSIERDRKKVIFLTRKKDN